MPCSPRWPSPGPKSGRSDPGLGNAFPSYRVQTDSRVQWGVQTDGSTKCGFDFFANGVRSLALGMNRFWGLV